MKIAIFSDVHDNLSSLTRAFSYFETENIRKAIFCGDFCSPIVAKVMGSFRGDIHCVFGNGDGDRFTVARVANTESRNLILHGEYAEIEVEGRRIAINHYPLLGRALAHTGDYDAVFSGHTHIASKEYVKNCLWLNPGEVMGWKATPTIACYETIDNSARILPLL